MLLPRFTRNGWLAPVIVMGTLVLTQFSVDWLLGAGYYETNDWPKGAGLVAAGTSTFFAVRKFDGEGPRSEFLFLPADFAGFLLTLVGIGTLCYDLINRVWPGL
ncbi:MAG: hypothetical protein NXI04_13610 [Planctomycetaceae bacterium]|nr:hypothetical protein [Planctomycetaceae bacterium]